MKEKSRFEYFDSLNQKRQKAVILMSQPSAKQVEVAKTLSLSEATLSRWIRAPEFQQALSEYEEYQFGALRNNAIETMSNLLSARSEMVRYNAASYILDKTMVERGFTEAEIRKTNAEADIKEAQAKAISNDEVVGDDGFLDALDVVGDKVWGEDDAD